MPGKKKMKDDKMMVGPSKFGMTTQGSRRQPAPMPEIKRRSRSRRQGA